jgi:ATP-dependent Clp protease ATP-binding subunit ClpB
LNRVDETVIFEPLGPPEIAAIVDLQVKRLGKVLADQRIAISLTDAARALIAADSYDPMYGARPVKRTLQTRLRDPLAEKILAGEVGPGDTVIVDRAGDALTFAKKA